MLKFVNIVCRFVYFICVLIFYLCLLSKNPYLIVQVTLSEQPSQRHPVGIVQEHFSPVGATSEVRSVSLSLCVF